MQSENIIPASLRDATILQLTMMNKKKKRHREKKSCLNPYSTVGLDKFGRMSAQLSAKRENISKKTGIPEAMVRFAYTSNGLVPVVLRTDCGSGIPKVSNLSHPTTMQDTQFKQNQNPNSQDEGDNAVKGVRKKKKKKNFGRIFYIDGQPGKTNRVQQSEGFLVKEVRRPISTTMGATLMAIILFVLVFYGRLCAICFTFALLCIVPKLRNDENDSISGTNYESSTVMMDLQSREYRKKVIMDGLLDRSHGRAKRASQLTQDNM